MKTGIIYLAESKTSGKIYIGQTVQGLEGRKQKHLNRAFNKNSNTYSTHFSNAIRKYGRDNFVWVILHDDIPYIELQKLEVSIIAEYDSFNNGYNSTKGGEGCVGFKHNSESKAKMSKSKKGKKLTAEHKAKMSRPGESSGNSKLTWEKVTEIRESYKTKKYTMINLAEKYSVVATTIEKIINNKTWVIELSSEDKKRIKEMKQLPGGNSKLNWNTVAEIRKLYKQGFQSHRGIAKIYKVTSSTIGGIIRNDTWKI